MTPEERANDLMKVRHVGKERAWAFFVRAIRDAEDAALERAAAHLEIIAPLSILISEGSPTERGLKIVMKELRGLQAAAIRALKSKPRQPNTPETAE